jgi:hypothetical protein
MSTSRFFAKRYFANACLGGILSITLCSMGCGGSPKPCNITAVISLNVTPTTASVNHAVIPRQHPGFPGTSWEFSLRRHNHCTGEFELDGKRSICSTLNFSDHAGNGHLHSGAGKPGDDQRGFRRWPDAYRPGNAELFLIDGLECRPLMGLVISANSPSSPLRSSE